MFGVIARRSRARLHGLALEEADDTLVMLARFWRVVDLLEAAQMQALDREIEAHGALAHRLRQPFYLWQWEALMAMRAHVAGRFAEAEERTHRALQLGQEARSPNALILFGTQLYLVRREQGRLGEMEEMLVGMMRQLPDFSLFPMGLAGLYAAQDERAKAAELFETLAEHDFEDVPFDMGYLTHLSIATRVACYLRDARRAELLLGLLTVAILAVGAFLRRRAKARQRRR